MRRPDPMTIERNAVAQLNMHYAHSTGESGRADWQLLNEHLLAVAQLAQQFGEPIGIGRAARLAGLLHDLGKYTPAFQARLDGAEERVDHSTAGAVIATTLARGDDRIIAELVAYTIAGHHAGLPDRQGESNATLDARIRAYSGSTLDSAWRNEIVPEATGLLPDFKWSRDRARLAFQSGLLGRMIFSCLVDADFRDTETFYSRVEGREIDREWPALQSLLPAFTTAFEPTWDACAERTRRSIACVTNPRSRPLACSTSGRACSR